MSINVQFSAESVDELLAELRKLCGNAPLVAAQYGTTGQPKVLTADHDNGAEAAKPKTRAAPAKAGAAVETVAPEKEATAAVSDKAPEGDTAPAAKNEAAFTEFKQAMLDVMAKKSAKMVQQILEETVGTKVPAQVKPADYAKVTAAFRKALVE